MIVYKITNTLNGKLYFGITAYSLAHRWSAHCRVKSHCTILATAIQKYGRDSFTKEIVAESLTREEASKLEIELIEKFNTLGSGGYNGTRGGEGAPHTEASKKKLSEAKMGSKNPMFGKKMSQEHKDKIAEALRGKKRPPEVIEKLRASHNPKSNENLRRKGKRKPLSAEHKAKISKRVTGTVRSPETRLKMSKNHNPKSNLNLNRSI